MSSDRTIVVAQFGRRTSPLFSADAAADTAAEAEAKESLLWATILRFLCVLLLLRPPLLLPVLKMKR
jgi:hypothetical protein